MLYWSIRRGRQGLNLMRMCYFPYEWVVRCERTLGLAMALNSWSMEARSPNCSRGMPHTKAASR